MNTTPSPQTDTALTGVVPQQSRFFRNAGLGMLGFVVLAFGAAAVVQPFRIARYARPEVIVHIGLVLGWLVLFIVQSQLAGNGAIARHRKNLGLAALLVVLIAAQAMHLTYRWGDAERFVGESRDVLAFAALFAAAVWVAKRGRYEVHKRLMLIATLNLLGPAYARLGAVLEWSIPMGLLATILTWILPPVAYDLLTRRAIHWASIAGIVFSIATWALMLAIILSPFMGVIESWFPP